MGTKTWLVILFVGVVLLGLLRTDFASKAARKPSTLELSFWNGFTGPDGRVMLGIVREFNQSHPNVHATMQRMEWATYYNKVLVGNADGRGPDVFVCTASYLPRMVRAGFVSVADEIYDLSQGGPPLADFDQKVLDQLLYDGHYMGMALDIHPHGLYCNAAMLREIGFVDDKGNARAPRTAQEFIEVGQKLAERKSAGFWGYSNTNFQYNFMTLLPQFGGVLLDDEGDPALDSPQSIQALDTLVSFIRDARIAPQPENNLGWVGFRQKRIGMVWEGVYMLGDLKRLDGFECIGAPIPQFGPHPGTHGDSHILCIRKGISDGKRKAALEFVRFLSAHSLDWAEAGQVPARRSARDTDRFRAMSIQDEFSKQLPYVKYPPRSQIQIELLGEVNTAVERALRGRMSPAESLKIAQTNAKRFVEREKLERGTTALSAGLTSASERGAPLP